MRARYHASVPFREVKHSCAIVASVDCLQKRRSNVAAQAGPQEDSDVWRQTPSDQRSWKSPAFKGLPIGLMYGISRPSASRPGKNQLPAMRRNLAFRENLR